MNRLKKVIQEAASVQKVDYENVKQVWYHMLSETVTLNIKDLRVIGEKWGGYDSVYV